MRVFFLSSQTRHAYAIALFSRYFYQPAIRPKKTLKDINNADGYDVLSVVGEEDLRALSIEVKASSMGMSGSLHLTRNEWEMSQERERHLFHLWDICSEPPRLAKVTAPVMLAHVPADAGRGRWEVVAVPFSAFAPMFEFQAGLLLR